MNMSDIFTHLYYIFIALCIHGFVTGDCAVVRKWKWWMIHLPLARRFFIFLYVIVALAVDFPTLFAPSVTAIDQGLSLALIMPLTLSGKVADSLFLHVRRSIPSLITPLVIALALSVANGLSMTACLFTLLPLFASFYPSDKVLLTRRIEDYPGCLAPLWRFLRNTLLHIINHLKNKQPQ
jgi:hypothetical protein